MYAMVIDDFSAKSLSCIFEKHIDKKAQITTDLWRGYRPLTQNFNIAQIPSNNGLNFKALHTMIHQAKSWIRTTFSWVSSFNINRHFDEFCCRLNRSQDKELIINNLINRMVMADNIEHSKLVCA